MNIPEHVEPMIVLGNDNDYLVVYTYLTNEDAIEFLKRSLQILEHEKQLEVESSGQMH